MRSEGIGGRLRIESKVEDTGLIVEIVSEDSGHRSGSILCPIGAPGVDGGGGGSNSKDEFHL